MEEPMTDTSNVVPMGTPAPRGPDGGVAQQRYRRKQTRSRKRRNKAPKTAHETVEITSQNAAALEAENPSLANDMVSSSERLPEHRSQRVPADAERPVWRHRDRGIDTTPSAASLTLLDAVAYLVAVALAGSAAYFSITGMVVLFPAAGLAIVVMAGVMETAKLVIAGWLSSRWRETFWLWRLLLIGFVLGLMSINAVGLYSQLVQAHVGHSGEIAAANETSDARIAARIEVATGRVADIDRRLAQIDGAVDGAAKKGNAKTAVSVMQGQQKARAALAGEREQAAKALADLKAERAAGAAKGHAAEAEAAPVQYVAQLFGIYAGGEEVIRWLIAAMVACCDPLAVVLAAAIAARRRRWA
jgi:hypothetical protein